MKVLPGGEELERIAHQFLWDNGYLAFNQVKLLETKVTGSGNLESKDVTDLDAYGICFGPYLEKRSFLIDCKHRSQSSYLQILKAKGIAEILKISNLLIIRSSVPEIVQQFADRFGIRTLAENSFRKRIKPREAGSFSTEAILKTRKFMINIPNEIKTLNYSLIGTIIQPNPFIRIKRIIGIYEDTKAVLMGEDLWKELTTPNHYSYFIFRIFQQLQIAIADISSSSVHLSSYHLKPYILRSSIGDIQLKLELFSDLLNEDLREKNHSSDEESEKKGPLWKIAPWFTKDLLQTVKEINTRPEFLQKYLRYVDFVFHDSFLIGKPLDHYRVKKELGKLSRKLLVRWSTNCLKVMDKERTYPDFLVRLLA